MARIVNLALLLTAAVALKPTRRLFFSNAAAAACGAALPARADSGVPMDLGPLGLRKEGASGKLNTCPPNGIKRGCISTSSLERTEVYVPPWVYQAEDSGAVVTELSKMKSTNVKSVETAVGELP